jgi:hypothetical protein
MVDEVCREPHFGYLSFLAFLLGGFGSSVMGGRVGVVEIRFGWSVLVSAQFRGSQSQSRFEMGIRARAINENQALFLQG